MPEINDRFQKRLRRFVTALNNRKPDMIPIRPFAAEFTGIHAGYNCQQLTQNYPDAFEAMIQCCRDYDWDAVPANMIYVWPCITDAASIRYYGVPGVDVPPDRGFQYIEPPEDQSFMRADEYDRLIADPAAFLYEVWLPRATGELPAQAHKTLSVAMWHWFHPPWLWFSILTLMGRTADA